MKRYKKITTIVPILLMMLVFSFGAVLEYRHTIELEKEALREELNNVQANIEHLISARIMNANGMAGIIEINESLDKHMYDVFAKSIYETESGVVKDVVFITDTTISYIYPEALSGDSIGVDLAEIPSQRDLILYSKEELVEVFLGPVDLVEGGRGIIVRVPVAINGDYYGQVAIVFDYEKFVDNSGLKDLANDNNVFMKGYLPIEENYATIWHSGHVVTDDYISEEVKLNNIEWIVCAEPLNGWNGFSQLFYVIIVAGFLVVIGASFAYRKEDMLKQELEKLAKQDELTGLYNRRMFRKDLKASIESGQRGIVVLVDIDDFKNVNDIHGHIFGDQMLIDFARSLTQVVGDLGRCYRFGGDEFLVIFEGIYTTEFINVRAREIREAVQNTMASQTLHHLTLSVGVVRFPEQGLDVNSLLKKADVAMYQAKFAGKNQMKQFTEDMLTVLDKKINIEKHIKGGLKDDGFEMHYQPIVHSLTEEIVSFEALIRFKNRAFSPFEFIEVAEQSGLIMPLGMWIIEEVVSTIARWQVIGYQVPPVAINLSPRQLLAPNFRKDFFALLENYSVSSELIEIEITENILLENEVENIEVLNDLKDAGIAISMDDFGTGYSSLKYLTYLPINKVKIDKSLKDQFMAHKNCELLSGIIMMVHGLGYKVVAEGIETLEELEKLRQLDCDEIQGYYFSKPLPKEEVEDLLAKKETDFS